MKYSDAAKDVFDREIEYLQNMYDILGESFDNFVLDLDKCNGHLIWIGIGKSGHICKKIVATMQSLGIKSFFLHPSEALHGDLGIVSQNDIAIIVSNSGETKEIVDLITPLKNLNAKIYSIIGRHNSTLEKLSTKSLILKLSKEVFLDMVPTTSTTATLLLGDAIAVSIAKKRGFSKNDFGKYHPNGQLGKKLTMRVSDIMIDESDNSIVLTGSNLEQALFEMCRKPVGCVSIVDKNGFLKGLLTDGDLRRIIYDNTIDLKNTVIDECMITNPIVLQSNYKLMDAINEVISKNSVSVYPVVDESGKIVGTLRTIDVIKSGLIE